MSTSQDYWNNLGKNSILLNAVSNWRDDYEQWFLKSVDRLPETVRVNYLRRDWVWVEEWLVKNGAKKLNGLEILKEVPGLYLLKEGRRKGRLNLFFLPYIELEELLDKNLFL